MARHGIATYDDLLARATADPAWYWGAVADDLALVWSRPYEQVLDLLSRRALGGVVHRRRVQLRHQRARSACRQDPAASAPR